MKIRISTWNLKRLEMRKNQEILEKLVELDADILVLTETNSLIKLENYTCISTECLPSTFDGVKYVSGENRVSVWTRFETITKYETFDCYTSVCTDIITPFGPLTVYGAIIGVFANRQPHFDNDLNGQLEDFERIFPNKQICFIGDLNVTFSGRPWPSIKARKTLVDTFEKFNLTNMTSNIDGTVDHIVLSTDFIKNKKAEIETWNNDKKLSDHVGHLLTLTQ